MSCFPCKRNVPPGNVHLCLSCVFLPSASFLFLVLVPVCLIAREISARRNLGGHFVSKTIKTPPAPVSLAWLPGFLERRLDRRKLLEGFLVVLGSGAPLGLPVSSSVG